MGVDSKTKMIHTVVATAANVADQHGIAGVTARGRDEGLGRSGLSRADGSHPGVAPGAQDMTHKQYRYKDRVDEIQRAKNRTKSRVRSKVEHVFGVMKLKFGFVKVRYRGLEKECQPAVRHLRAGESVLGAQKTVASGTGLAPPRRMQITPAAEAGWRLGKIDSERLHRPGRVLTTSKTLAYSEFP